MHTDPNVKTKITSKKITLLDFKIGKSSPPYSLLQFLGLLFCPLVTTNRPLWQLSLQRRITHELRPTKPNSTEDFTGNFLLNFVAHAGCSCPLKIQSKPKTNSTGCSPDEKEWNYIYKLKIHKRRENNLLVNCSLTRVVYNQGDGTSNCTLLYIQNTKEMTAEIKNTKQKWKHRDKCLPKPNWKDLFFVSMSFLLNDSYCMCRTKMLNK